MRRFRVGIIGYGNLGKAFARLLRTQRDVLQAEGLDLVLTCVFGRDGSLRDPDGLALSGSEKRLSDVPGFSRGAAFHDLDNPGSLMDIAAEFTPTNKETGEPGLSHIRKCLQSGVHVVTGNKGPILNNIEELDALARKNGLLLGISCTTGGALPTILNGYDAMGGSTVLSIEGILNGTSNFILDQMEQSGASYEAALGEAQAAGIAEANPVMDVGGWDTAVKLLILTRAIMNTPLRLPDISVRGITGVTPDDVRKAHESGGRIKLVGRAWRDSANKIRAEVAPLVVSSENPLYNVSGKNKGMRYVSDTMGELFISGGASDPVAAAAASLRDLVNAHRRGLLKKAKS